jgi:hypothetical protein
MKTFRADNKKDNGTPPALSRVSRVEASHNSERVAIIIPVLNDWDSLDVLLPALDEALGSRGWVGEILLVNDGSVLPITETLRRRTYLHLESVEVLHLLRNLGHQRAIAVGLTHLYKTRSGLRAIVIMLVTPEPQPAPDQPDHHQQGHREQRPFPDLPVQGQADSEWPEHGDTGQ